MSANTAGRRKEYKQIRIKIDRAGIDFYIPFSGLIVFMIAAVIVIINIKQGG